MAVLRGGRWGATCKNWVKIIVFRTYFCIKKPSIKRQFQTVGAPSFPGVRGAITSCYATEYNQLKIATKSLTESVHVHWFFLILPADSAKTNLVLLCPLAISNISSYVKASVRVLLF